MKIKSVVHPQKKLTYEEWVETLKKERKVVVSGLARAKSVGTRILIEESLEYKIPQRVQPGILFDVDKVHEKTKLF